MRKIIPLLLVVSLVMVGCTMGTGGGYTVSGKITIGDTTEGLGNVEIVADGFGMTTSDPNGNWALSGLKGVVEISAEKSGWDFRPASQKVSGAVSGIDFKAIRPQGSLFDDPNLEAVVRDRIGKPNGPLSAEDVSRLRFLHGAEQGIKRLGGIEHMVSLKQLTLDHNNIADLTPLQTLAGLEALSLYNNNVSDLTPLANLTNLNQLWLQQNEITDISPLQHLTKLNLLVLEHNQIADVGALAGLRSLGRLYLANNQIVDVGPLANLINLNLLHLAHNKIENFNALGGLPHLSALHLSSNAINDISGLSRLGSLQVLSLDHNPIKDIGTLSLPSRLYSLSLMETQLTSIEPLEYLSNLEKLNLSQNQLTDISPLVRNTGLGQAARVVISYNCLDLSPGSRNAKDIQALLDRGVNLDYLPQKQALGD